MSDTWVLTKPDSDGFVDVIDADTRECVTACVWPKVGNLIAAAPRMQAALEESDKDLVAAQVNARRAAKYDDKWEGVAEAIQPTIDQARAALKKSRGES